MVKHIKIFAVLVMLVVLMFCCACEQKYDGAHIIAGELSGDVEIIRSESVSFYMVELTLKDGSHIRLEKGNFILFKGVCPICGERRDNDTH